MEISDEVADKIGISIYPNLYESSFRDGLRKILNELKANSKISIILRYGFNKTRNEILKELKILKLTRSKSPGIVCELIRKSLWEINRPSKKMILMGGLENYLEKNNLKEFIKHRVFTETININVKKLYDYILEIEMSLKNN